MKQNITLDDLNQLSDNGKERLIEWKVKHDREQTTKEQIEAPTFTDIAILEGSLMSQIGNGKWLCLNIGEMIEFLGEDLTIQITNTEDNYAELTDESWWVKGNRNYLCDVLWCACVVVLNDEV